MRKIYLLISLFLVVLSSCNKDDNGATQTPGGEGEVEVEFNSPIAYASSPADDTVEKRILELDLLVFDKDGKYQYMRQAYSSNYATFRSVLKIDSDLTIYFFANSRALLQQYEADDILVENALLADLETKLIIQQPRLEQSGQIALPMWGKLTGVTLTDSQINNLDEVQLLRTVASAEIVFSVDKSVFEFTEIYVYNPTTSALMVPHVTTYNENLLVLAPYCPDGSTTGARYDYSASVKDQSVIEAVYMFENDTDKAKGRNRTRLVVGGKYKGGSVTYYPLDFKVKNSSNKDEIVNVLRNHKYILGVTAVNGEGWEDPDEAAESAAVNLEYEVVDWTDSTDGTIIIDGPDYVSIQARSVTLYGDVNSSKSLTFSTNVATENIKMAFTAAGTPVTNSEGVTVGMQTEHYKAELIFDGQLITHLRITALRAYASAYSSEVLTITAGRIKFTIKINREKDGEFDWGDGGNNEVNVGN